MHAPASVAVAGSSALDLLAAVLRGDATEWPVSHGAAGGQAFLDAAVEHRVEPLVVWRLRRAGTLDRWPETVRGPLAEDARKVALFEAAREGELRRVLAALDRAGVGCLLMKGAALAYTRYPKPWLRPRLDNDLLVSASDLDEAARVFRDLSYETTNELTGDFVSHQLPWVRIDRLGLRHVFDVHWKINNRPLLSDLLPFEELLARATPVPALGALVPGDLDALLLACLHPVSHHRNSDSLVWCYDIHLLAGGLCPAELDRFVTLALEKQVAAICAAGLQHASMHFHTAVPPDVIDRLSVGGEPSAAYLGPSAWRGDVRLWDVRALPGWRAKMRYVREVAIPDADFMLKEYDCPTRALVPALHVHRLARGTWRLLRRFAR